VREVLSPGNVGGFLEFDVTQVAEQNQLSHFTPLEMNVNGKPPPAWIEKLRQSARARFEEVGFPLKKTEAWRFTNISPIARTEWEPAEVGNLQQVAPLVEKFTFGREAIVELVFVNGHFHGELSRMGKLPRGVRIESLAEGIANDVPTVQKHLGQYALIEGNPFVALNTALIGDGALIHLPAGASIEQPIHILLISTGGERPVAAHPRVLVVAEENVRATVVESYVGAEGRTYFTNAVTEIICGADSHIDHCRLQQESTAAYHISTMQVELARSATFVSHACSIGAKLSRNDLNCLMNGERAYATLNGLVLIGGEQHCDNHTLLHHAKANCPSHELYKHVLDGKATAVFKGQIFVEREAQKTDSKQTSKTLLLSDDAYMNSQPALEIYADDVKCTHGSTTGPVDEDMVFYLRTRGVGLESARHLLTYAFAADVTRRIKVEPVRRRIEDYMAARHGLPQDLRITDVATHDRAAL
jgi:Fe-S cluster assembly protein SufD